MKTKICRHLSCQAVQRQGNPHRASRRQGSRLAALLALLAGLAGLEPKRASASDL